MNEIATYKALTAEQVDLIKRTVAKGATDDELALFLYQAKRTGLDPLLRQIHAVKRWSEGKEAMAIQTGIDGYRLIADRTERYAPGAATIFQHENGKLVSATAFVKKLVAGVWHEVTAIAFYDEYVQKKKDGSPNRFWGGMPHNQLAKCAEALALRRAFPAELSGLYTHEEMAQADNESLPAVAEIVKREDSSEIHYDRSAPKTPAAEVISRIKAVEDLDGLKKAQDWWAEHHPDYDPVPQKMIGGALDKARARLTAPAELPGI